MFSFSHVNFNVADLDRALAFYREALGLRETRRKNAADGSFVIVYLADEAGSPFVLELTCLAGHGPYELGDNETHLAFATADMAKAHALHEKMGCICYENPQMGIYFIEDPDGYWLEIVPQ